MRTCYFCGATIDEGMQIYRTSTCPSCSKDLKICYNCKFYSEGAHWDCLETIREPVREKDRANFCEFFQFKKGQNSGAKINRPDNARIKNKSDRENKAKQDFNKLFGN